MISVPVNFLKSVKEAMDENMHSSLKSVQFPVIIWSSYLYPDKKVKTHGDINLNFKNHEITKKVLQQRV